MRDRIRPGALSITPSCEVALKLPALHHRESCLGGEGGPRTLPPVSRIWSKLVSQHIFIYLLITSWGLAKALKCFLIRKRQKSIDLPNCCMGNCRRRHFEVLDAVSSCSCSPQLLSPRCVCVGRLLLSKGGCAPQTPSHGASCSPSRERQPWEVTFFFFFFFSTLNRGEFLGSSSQVRLIILFCFHDAAGFSSGHRLLFLFCGRRFNYSASKPHPLFPVQSPSGASLWVLVTWSHRVVLTASPLPLPKQ